MSFLDVIFGLTGATDAADLLGGSADLVSATTDIAPEITSGLSGADKALLFGIEGYGDGMTGAQTSMYDSVLDLTGSKELANLAANSGLSDYAKKMLLNKLNQQGSRSSDDAANYGNGTSQQSSYAVLEPVLAKKFTPGVWNPYLIGQAPQDEQQMQALLDILRTKA